MKSININQQDLETLNKFLDTLRSELHDVIDKETPQDAESWRHTRDDIVDSLVEEAISEILSDLAVNLANSYIANRNKS